MTECAIGLRFLTVLFEVFVLAGYLAIVDDWLTTDTPNLDKSANILFKASGFFIYLVIIAVGVWGIFGQIIGVAC